MKRLLLSLLLVLAGLVSQAAFLRNVPVTLVQPNGDTLHCFVTGDEFYQRMHDAQGYTIVQNHANGYYCYATKTIDGELIPTSILAVSTTMNMEKETHVAMAQLQSMGIAPGLMLSRSRISDRQKSYDIPMQYQMPSAPKTSGTNHGQVNNIVIFVRFAGDAEISTPLSSMDAMFNDSSSSSTSMYQYFWEASYNKLRVVSHYYPTPNNNSVISYQDTFARSYYCPYDATTNPNGYSNDTEHRLREFNLIERAVNYINANYPIPTSLNLDNDNDGMVDNVIFVVKGTYTGWSDLLWPHKWSLYDRNVYINNKRVYTFNLQLEGSGSHYFSSSTFCHEMFHTLGAPDLYRYDNDINVSSAGSWDLMGSNSTPPQHMSAWMKIKYGNWLDSIPEITIPGTYTLHSLAEPNLAEHPVRAYKVQSQDPNQWYVMEYRHNTDHFETALGGSGLLVWRVDTRYNGNANYNGTTQLDELYVFRPNASNDSTNGTVAQAYFGGSSSRRNFNPTTNPHPWINGNIADTTFALSNIGAAGTTISFTYSSLLGCMEPINLNSSIVDTASASLSWRGNSANYRLQYRLASMPQAVTTVNVNGSRHTVSNLIPGESYEFRVQGRCSASDTTGYSAWKPFSTTLCSTPSALNVGTYTQNSYRLPVNTYYNYSLTYQIYTAAEVGSAKQITGLAFNYNGTNPVTSKTSCTIYIGQTSLNTISAATAPACSTLTQVYQGSMNCVTGWNTFNLEQPFNYDGASNLIIAVFDNSGAYDGNSYTFECGSTSGNKVLTLYSDSDIPDPNNPSSYGGTSNTYSYRPLIRFDYCDATPSTVYYALVASCSPTEGGSVNGAGAYEEGASATVEAIPAEGYIFSHWTMPNGSTSTTNPLTVQVNTNMHIVANFIEFSEMKNIIVRSDDEAMGSVSGGGLFEVGETTTLTATANDHYYFTNWAFQGGTSTQNPLTITVTDHNTYTAYFRAQQYHISVNSSSRSRGEVSGAGSYSYGDTAVLTATPKPHYQFVSWTENDQVVSTENPLYLNVEADRNLRANFEPVQYTVTLEANLDPEWVELQGQGSYPYLSQVCIKAIPVSNRVVFNQWSDGVVDNPRYFELSQDTTFVAQLTLSEEGIVDAETPMFTLMTQGNILTVGNAEGMQVSVVDMLGRTLYSCAHASNRETIRLPHTGIYVVKVGTKAEKVFIR